MTKTRGKASDYAVLEGHLGHTFGDLELLERALTHKSYVNESDAPCQDNERLEFLGDAVLGLAAAQLIMELCPGRDEGELSSLRARVVNEQALAALAKTMELGQWLFLGRGEENTGGRYKTSLLADAYEALIGAIYQERGFDYALKVVRRLMGPQVERVAQSETMDFKSQLQEWAQARLRLRPRYEVVAEHGPDHDKTFEVAVWMASTEGAAVVMAEQAVARGQGKTKREAEQRAAELALAKLETAQRGDQAEAPTRAPA